MKKGFTLIEIVIAIAISGIIASSLYMLLQQTQRTVASIFTITSYDSEITTTYQQLLRDLTGAFAPSGAWPRQVSSPTQPPSTESSTDAKPSAEKSDTPQAPKKEPDKTVSYLPPEITNVFVYTAKNGMLSTLTFITHNPLSIYSDPEQAGSSVRAVRIMYTLKPTPDEPSAYMLMRQESSILDSKKFSDTKKIRAYELVRGIKTISCQFMYEPTSPEETKDAASAEQQEEQQAEKKSVKRFRTVTSWSSDELAQKPDNTLVPSYIRIKIEFTQTPLPIEFLIPIEGPGLPPRKPLSPLQPQKTSDQQKDTKTPTNNNKKPTPPTQRPQQMTGGR